MFTLNKVHKGRPWRGREIEKFLAKVNRRWSVCMTCGDFPLLMLWGSLLVVDRAEKSSEKRRVNHRTSPTFLYASLTATFPINCYRFKPSIIPFKDVASRFLLFTCDVNLWFRIYGLTSADNGAICATLLVGFLAHYKIDNLRQEILLTAQRGQGQLAVVGPTERGFRNRLSWLRRGKRGKKSPNKAIKTITRAECLSRINLSRRFTLLLANQ